MRGIALSLPGILAPRNPYCPRAARAFEFQIKCRIRHSSSTSKPLVRRGDSQKLGSLQEVDGNFEPVDQVRGARETVQPVPDKYVLSDENGGGQRGVLEPNGELNGRDEKSAFLSDDTQTEKVDRLQLIKRRRYRDLPQMEVKENIATRPLLLTLDAFGTIFHPSESVEKQYCDVAESHGIKLTEASVLASFKKEFKSLSASHPNYGRESGKSVKSWWSDLIQNTLRPLLPPDTNLPDQLVDDLFVRFSTSKGYTLYPDVSQLLDLLGTSRSANQWPPRRTLLGVLSNSDPRVRSILQSFSIPILPSLFPPRYAPAHRYAHHDFGPAHFSFATLSYEAGFSKPDKGIYDAALRDAQYTIERLAIVARMTRTGSHLLEDVRSEFHVMHVGDELEKDVIPAIKCGWDAVLLDRNSPDEISEREIQFEITSDDYIFQFEEPLEGAQDEQEKPHEQDVQQPQHKTEFKTRTETVKLPVINNLLALKHLVTKSRFEMLESDEPDALDTYVPAQRPVFLDESKPTEHFVDTISHLDPQDQKAAYSGQRLVLHPRRSRDGEDDGEGQGRKFPMVMYV